MGGGWNWAEEGQPEGKIGAGSGWERQQSLPPYPMPPPRPKRPTQTKQQARIRGARHGEYLFPYPKETLAAALAPQDTAAAILVAFYL